MGKNDELYKEALTDTDKILFGKYSGTRLIDLDPGYLLWLWDQKWFHENGFEHEVRVRHYIKENLEVLKKELQQKAKKFS